MKTCTVHKDKFTYPKDFHSEDYIDPSFGVFATEDKVNIAIKFYSGTSSIIKERIWHPNQEIEELSDGCPSKNQTLVELSLPKDSNLYASEYHLYLPSKELFENAVEKLKLEAYLDSMKYKKISASDVAVTNEKVLSIEEINILIEKADNRLS